jgi:hypothetical protein
MRKMQAASFAELVTMVASLRGETVAIGTSFHASPEPLTRATTLVESTHLSNFGLVPA